MRQAAGNRSGRESADRPAGRLRRARVAHRDALGPSAPPGGGALLIVGQFVALARKIVSPLRMEDGSPV